MKKEKNKKVLFDSRREDLNKISILLWLAQWAKVLDRLVAAAVSTRLNKILLILQQDGPANLFKNWNTNTGEHCQPV